jgi:hypothetical protein
MSRCGRMLSVYVVAFASALDAIGAQSLGPTAAEVRETSGRRRTVALRANRAPVIDGKLSSQRRLDASPARLPGRDPHDRQPGFQRRRLQCKRGVAMGIPSGLHAVHGVEPGTEHPGMGRERFAQWSLERVVALTGHDRIAHETEPLPRTIGAASPGRVPNAVYVWDRMANGWDEPAVLPVTFWLEPVSK